MRRTLLALSALCPLAFAGVAAADPAPPGTGTLTVRAFTGSEPLPVNRADIAVTPCDAEEAIVTLVSGPDGSATVSLPDGCYEAKVVTVPGGCGLTDTDPVRLTVVAGAEAQAGFRFGCA
ncbi:hypothetical protein [Nocardia mangyaensis]|uniref:hypothetical protein n=1 Tax=Nocardia mangyaensis TaxID=2213200 RepID=UPI0026755BCC|nr:hypothetical protein [Nocardia mangyaensis]MDO3649662.1 hypothetical protein [Nocardia mangyaensis]